MHKELNMRNINSIEIKLIEPFRIRISIFNRTTIQIHKQMRDRLTSLWEATSIGLMIKSLSMCLTGLRCIEERAWPRFQKSKLNQVINLKEAQQQPISVVIRKLSGQTDKAQTLTSTSVDKRSLKIRATLKLPKILHPKQLQQSVRS